MPFAESCICGNCLPCPLQTPRQPDATKTLRNQPRLEKRSRSISVKVAGQSRHSLPNYGCMITNVCLTPAGEHAPVARTLPTCACSPRCHHALLNLNRLTEVVNAVAHAGNKATQTIATQHRQQQQQQQTRTPFSQPALSYPPTTPSPTTRDTEQNSPPLPPLLSPSRPQAMGAACKGLETHRDKI